MYRNNESGSQIKKTSVYGIALTLMLGACTLAPEYQRPEVNSHFPLPPPALSAETQLKAHQIGWSNYFEDPQLKMLISIGLKNNQEVQKAILNLKEANAQYGLDIYQLIPNLQFEEGGISKTRSGALDSSSRTLIRQSYSSGLGVTNFELNIYRKFDEGRAAAHKVKATYYDRLAAEIKTISSIAKKYFDVRFSEEKLNNASKSVEYQKEFYRIQTLRYKAGIISKLDLLEHQSAFDTAQSHYLTAKQAYDKTVNELTLLIGQPIPTNLPARKPLDQQFAYTNFPKDLSSEVMLYRPDIRKLEEDLQKNNAEIGVARAAFFPKITLHGGISTSAAHFEDLFSKGAVSFRAGPEITIPLFNIFPNITNLKLTKIAKEKMLLEYQSAIQRAFFEVITAINVSNDLNSQYSVSARIMENSKESRDLTRLKFNQGIANKDQMLDAESKFIVNQNEFLDIQKAKLNNQVDLYTSLGGGINQYNVKQKVESKPNKNKAATTNTNENL